MTVHLPKWLFGLVLAAALSFMIGGDAGGVTPWQKFGDSWARAGGNGQSFEHPYISISGSTFNRPVAVKFVVKSFHAQQTADLSWYLTCWRGSNYGSRSGSQDNVALPYTRQFNLPIANPDYCSLDVMAFLNSQGRVIVQLWAQYP